uniref:Uncharacterized protein n=1 Tax=Panagrolaimus davidi TaxID=227884 RepID=A0A914RAF1_9BILA
MASANLKTVAVRFTRSLMLNTGKKINHLDSDDDSDENEHHHSNNWMIVAEKIITNSSSFTLLRGLTSESDLNGQNESNSANLEEFEEKQIFHIDDDFELPSHEHGTVLFR